MTNNLARAIASKSRVKSRLEKVKKERMQSCDHTRTDRKTDKTKENRMCRKILLRTERSEDQSNEETQDTGYRDHSGVWGNLWSKYMGIIENFGNAKKEWLDKYLELPNGIPSHDTFGRVFGRIDAEQFQTCFMKWMKAVMHKTNGDVLAIDGKKLRRSHDKTIGKNAIHMVSVWATENRLVLVQRKSG